MTLEFVNGMLLNAIKTTILLATPMLMVGLTVGILVSIFQTVTQINEMTLVFVPKMLGVALALLFFFPWMLRIIIDFTSSIIVNIPTYVH